MSGPLGSSQWIYSSGQEFDIGQSVKFNDDDSQDLTFTPSSDTSSSKKGTFSCWMKVASNSGTNGGTFIGAADGYHYGQFYNNALYFGNTSSYISTAAVFRDYSAWMNVLFVFDTTLATSADRMQIWVNGVRQSLGTFTTQPSQNSSFTFLNTTQKYYLGSRGNTYFDGYLADVYFIDGQALAPTDFAETVDGYWKAKEYDGTFGTNGWHLNFKDDVVSEGFNTLTYTGTGANQSLSGLGFSPDLVWTKERNSTGWHRINDSVRGTAKQLYTNATNAEDTAANNMLSFDADGFTVGTDTSINGSGDTYVNWCWDAGANNAATGHSSVTYKGNATDNTEIRGLPFEADLLWIKERTSTSGHILVDSVRGATGNVMNSLLAQSTAAQDTSSVYVRRLTDKGFVIGSGGSTNSSADTYMAWAWDAGTGSAASNTDGDITSTVKASDTHGFSIGTFTKGSGTQSVGHGLSTAPDWLIVKRYSGGTGSWFVYHSSNTANPETDYLRLNSDGATTDDATIFGDTAPTSSVFTVGSGFNSGEDMLFYAWSAKSGYSDFGSYTGNGSASGPTITTGFRPGLVLCKRTDSTMSWVMFDGTRDPLNPVSHRLNPNSTSAEGTNVDLCNFTDTGFTITTADNVINASSGTYVYAAFKGSYSDYVSDINTDGSVDSRVKANPSYGFSIVNYTATGSGDITVGHGLGVTPSLIIGKTRNQAYGWRVFHTDLGGTKQLALNSNAAAATANAFGQTNPTSSVFTAGRGGDENLNYASGDTVVCYCFAEVSGSSKISSYTGTGAVNNSVTGVGFEPAFLLIKRTDSTGWWTIFDNTRNPVNPRTRNLFPNAANAEIEYASPNPVVDFDSDGFTLQTTDGGSNASGGSYIYMAFADTREYAFWKDVSGNGNHWTPNKLDYRDSMPDTPQNNFAVLNAVDAGNGTPTFSEGNLKASWTTSATGVARSTIGVSSGKWYAEFYINGTGTREVVGVLSDGATLDQYIGHDAYGWGYFSVNGDKYNNGTNATYGATYTAGDIIGVALDMDAGTVTFYKNGTSQGQAYTGLSGTFFIGISDSNASIACSGTANFGQDSTFSGAKAPGSYTDANGIGSFQYDPSSYLALCTSNLPTPTIVDGSQHFNTVLYTGDNADRNIDVGFKSDFVWLKHRNGASAHRLHDSVRGDGKTLFSNLTNVEYDGVDDGVEFTYADGFNIDVGANVASYNASGSTYATWNWKAGGTAVSNTNGSITSSVSANTDMGFSIVSFDFQSTGNQTIGHGLGVQPSMIIMKSRDSSADAWWVYHESLGASNYLRLNSTNASSANSAVWSTTPTNQVFTIGSLMTTSNYGTSQIAYCFANSDIIKASSYTGTGSSDGPLIFTNGRPSFFLVKRSDSGAHHWRLFDAARSTFNEVDDYLAPSNANAEAVGKDVDFVSNGVKIRTTDSDLNTSGGTYIYLCIMETPLKFANAR